MWVMAGAAHDEGTDAGVQMARTDIYVAGDTASYPDRVLGRRRMQSFDHSFYSGLLAGDPDPDPDPDPDT